jgi:hypothetical protein
MITTLDYQAESVLKSYLNLITGKRVAVFHWKIASWCKRGHEKDPRMPLLAKT